jgi:hypothetical protein
VIAEVGVPFYEPLDIQQVFAPLAAARRWILRSPDLSLEDVFDPRDGQLQAEDIPLLGALREWKVVGVGLDLNAQAGVLHRDIRCVETPRHRTVPLPH